MNETTTKEQRIACFGRTAARRPTHAWPLVTQVHISLPITITILLVIFIIILNLTLIPTVFIIRRPRALRPRTLSSTGSRPCRRRRPGSTRGSPLPRPRDDFRLELAVRSEEALRGKQHQEISRAFPNIRPHQRGDEVQDFHPPAPGRALVLGNPTYLDGLFRRVHAAEVSADVRDQRPAVGGGDVGPPRVEDAQGFALVLAFAVAELGEAVAAVETLFGDDFLGYCRGDVDSGWGGAG